MVNKIIFGKPFINQDAIDDVRDILKSGWIGLGKKVDIFENDFAKYKKASNTLALNSCTSALHLALISLNLKRSDEVITTPLTFVSTVNTIIQAGGRPVFADVDINTANICPISLEGKITKKTKAILIVHLYGRPCNIKKILPIAKKYNLRLIEDCAHAIEAKYNNKHCGTFGDFGCFSFYPNKNITTVEGGMLISRNRKEHNFLKTLSLNGLTKPAWKRFQKRYYEHYDAIAPGYKYNMTDIQAAIGISQLKKINQNLKKREKIWNIYNSAFDDLDIVPRYNIINNNENIVHSRHLYTLRIKNKKISRDQFIKKLNERNIGTGVHYKNILDMTFFKKNFKGNKNQCPNSRKISRETISIPLYPSLSQSSINKIIDNIRKILK